MSPIIYTEGWGMKGKKSPANKLTFKRDGKWNLGVEGGQWPKGDKNPAKSSKSRKDFAKEQRLK